MFEPLSIQHFQIIFGAFLKQSKPIKQTFNLWIITYISLNKKICLYNNIYVKHHN